MKQAAWLASALVAVLTPAVASAEVMDKEPSLGRLWVTAVLLGGAGLLAWRRGPMLGVLVTALALPLVWSFHWELTDPFVGRDIVLEAGQGYVRQAYGSMLLCTALHLGGIVAYFVKWRRKPERGRLVA